MQRNIREIIISPENPLNFMQFVKEQNVSKILVACDLGDYRSATLRQILLQFVQASGLNIEILRQFGAWTAYPYQKYVVSSGKPNSTGFNELYGVDKVNALHAVLLEETIDLVFFRNNDKFFLDNDRELDAKVIQKYSKNLMNALKGINVMFLVDHDRETHRKALHILAELGTPVALVILPLSNTILNPDPKLEIDSKSKEAYAEFDKLLRRYIILEKDNFDVISIVNESEEPRVKFP